MVSNEPMILDWIEDQDEDCYVAYDIIDWISSLSPYV
jgi:hypothetical protein